MPRRARKSSLRTAVVAKTHLYGVTFSATRTFNHILLSVARGRDPNRVPRCYNEQVQAEWPHDHETGVARSALE